MLINSSERKIVVNTLVLNGPLIFFSVTALMGMRFSKEEGAGSLYKIYMAILFVLGVYPLFNRFIKNQLQTKCVLPLFVIFVYILLGYIQLHDDAGFFLQMVCFTLPPTCVALTMDKLGGLMGMMKWIELLLPLFAISFIFMIRNMLLEKLEGDLTSYDQSASYYAAFLFIIVVYLLRYNKVRPKFAFMDRKWVKAVEVMLLPYFFVVCFFGGGRGAVVLLLVCLFFQIDLLKRIPISYYWKGFFILMVLTVFVYIGIEKLSDDYSDLLHQNFNRISALIEGGHVDTSASSGRDKIWEDAFNTWTINPLFGYGLFTYMDHFYVRPHNIFLEVMLQGGLLLLSILCYILLCAFVKYRRMLKIDKSQIFLMPFLLYTFTELSLSGSYWFEPFFWFVLVYIYSFNLKKARNMLLEE